METTRALRKAAKELVDCFDNRHRDSGERYVCRKDEAPEWTLDAIHTAHGGKLPNDWTYTTSQDIALAVAERLQEDSTDMDEGRFEIVDASVSVYHSERYAWLSSLLSRADYCDDAREEGLVAEDASISDRIAAGMYAEASEVFDALWSAIQERAEELEAEDAR